MKNFNKHLDKTYILWLFHDKGWTAYRLAKETGFSDATFSYVRNFKHSLVWEKIAKIQETTSCLFGCPEHIVFSTKLYMEKNHLFTDPSDAPESESDC